MPLLLLVMPLLLVAMPVVVAMPYAMTSKAPFALGEVKSTTSSFFPPDAQPPMLDGQSWIKSHEIVWDIVGCLELRNDRLKHKRAHSCR